MDPLLGFKEATSNLDENHKLVPWLNWDEWDFVRLCLFSSSSDFIAKSLRRIAAWRGRGCLPVVIEVTASIIEIQQKDPHFRVGLSDGDSESEEMLAMLYTMAIMRLVNGIIEKTRKKTEISIAEAADAIDIPRMLIDIRHEGSHRELPSLRLLRLASIKALNWLKSYYWEPQKNSIPYQGGKSANVRKEIKSRLRELAFSLKVKQSSGSSSSRVKKRAKHHEQLLGATVHGRNKFFSLINSKSLSSNYVGSRKQITRTLKNLARLYSFFSSDVVCVLLDFLLKASNSTEKVDSPNNFQINLSIDVARDVFDEWKPVITKLSKKEPELLLSLLKAVLDVIESRKAFRDDFGGEDFSLSRYDLERQRIEVLSSLFTWLVQVLIGLRSPHKEGEGSQIEGACAIPKQTLTELVRRCLYISDPENQELLGSALLLAKLVGTSHVNDKLHKLSQLISLYSRPIEDNPSDMKIEDLIGEDKYIRQAAEKLEFIKLRKINNSSDMSSTQDDNVKDTNIWTVVKSWNPCPIGMLPRAVGSSGCLPVLDFHGGSEDKAAFNSIDKEEDIDLTRSSKIEACCEIEAKNDNGVTKIRETENYELSEPDDMNMISISDGLKGRLLISGVWQKVGDREIQDIKSRVRSFVTRREI